MKHDEVTDNQYRKSKFECRHIIIHFNSWTWNSIQIKLHSCTCIQKKIRLNILLCSATFSSKCSLGFACITLKLWYEIAKRSTSDFVAIKCNRLIQQKIKLIIHKLWKLIKEIKHYENGHGYLALLAVKSVLFDSH